MSVSTIEYTITDKLRNFRKAIYYVAYYGIAVLLLFSGVSKIIDTTSLIEVLQQIKLPVDLVIITATLLPLTEIGLGLMLILKIQQQTALRITVLLFLGFFLFAIYGTLIGLNIDCGCFSSVVSSEFGIIMILRNLILTTIASWLVFTNTKFASAGRNNK